MLSIPSGRRAAIKFATAWQPVIGRRVAVKFGPVDTGPEIPDPEIVGDLTAATAMRWGGLEPRLRAVHSASEAFDTLTRRSLLPWGGLTAQVSRLSIAWGGLQLQYAKQDARWAQLQPEHAAVTRMPWDYNPIISNSRAARWAKSDALVRRASALPWTVPPSHARPGYIAWGGMQARLRTSGAPWTVPPKFEAPVHIRWGYGYGLEWVVRPPPQPPVPVPPKRIIGRGVAITFRCREYRHPPMRIPIRFGNLACYAARDLQRAYVVLNEIEVVRLPDLLPIAVDAVSLGYSRDTWCWDAQLQLADPAQLAAVQPTVDGPRKLRITLNGYACVIAVEAFDKSRVWGQTQTSLSGRSVTAQLAEPYAAPRAAEVTATRTMAQLAEAEVDGSGVAVEYNTVGWLVTGGAWYYDNMTPMAALLRLAEAGGGVVQSDPVDPTLRILPRYPASPWEWTTTAPDIEIQDDIVTGERLQLQSRPNFDAVIVAGEHVGVAARVIVEGEAGQTYAPQQIDQLITHADGARERGRNVLSDRGGQASIETDIPLFAAPLATGQPGRVMPLQLVRRITGEGTWHGLVTAVRINATRQDKAIDIVQTVTIERHYTDAD